MGFVTGPHARTPPHPQPVGSGPRQPAQGAGSRGWESARHRTPHTQAGGAPPRAPSCCPHSARSQLKRARAVGLVMGLHARTPPHPQPVGSGPRQPAQRAGSRGSESARPRTPHTQAGGAWGGASCLGVGRPRSGALPPPTARLLGGLPGPTTHWLWVRGGAGVGTRHKPHSARSCELALRAVEAAWGRRESQLARARAVGLVTAPHARTTPAPTASG